MPVDEELYRALAGSFPTGVTIVTAMGQDGQPRGLTTQSFAGLSVDPPLMLVCVDKSSRTLRALEHSRAFVVNFLKAGSEALSTRFASKEEDKFSDVRWQPSRVARGAPLLLEASVACAECLVTETVDAGDHWIYIGRVEGGRVLGGAPLVYYRRTYAAWLAETPAPPRVD